MVTGIKLWEGVRMNDLYERLAQFVDDLPAGYPAHRKQG